MLRFVNEITAELETICWFRLLMLNMNIFSKVCKYPFIHLHSEPKWFRYSQNTNRATNRRSDLFCKWTGTESELLFLYPCRGYYDFSQKFATRWRKHFRPHKVYIKKIGWKIIRNKL